jgi:hypothetical protein
MIRQRVTKMLHEVSPEQQINDVCIKKRRRDHNINSIYKRNRARRMNYHYYFFVHMAHSPVHNLISCIGLACLSYFIYLSCFISIMFSS